MRSRITLEAAESSVIIKSPEAGLQWAFHLLQADVSLYFLALVNEQVMHP
jgi:hypothetical protein